MMGIANWFELRFWIELMARSKDKVDDFGLCKVDLLLEGAIIYSAFFSTRMKKKSLQHPEQK